MFLIPSDFDSFRKIRQFYAKFDTKSLCTRNFYILKLSEYGRKVSSQISLATCLGTRMI